MSAHGPRLLGEVLLVVTELSVSSWYPRPSAAVCMSVTKGMKQERNHMLGDCLIYP